MGTARTAASERAQPVEGNLAASFISSPYLLCSGLGLLYLLTLTADYFWDGITFALQIEKVAGGERGMDLLFHQSHLLYNALGYLLLRCATAAGFVTRALSVLQIANCVFAAAATAIFFQMVERVTRSRYAASVCSAALGFSAVWWKLATDADAYIPALLLVLICARNLLGPRPRWYIAGLALAGGMLVHELASLFFPAAVTACLLSTNIPRRRSFALGLSAASWGPVLTAYYAVAGSLHGIWSPLGVIRWATSNPSRLSPVANPWPGILLTPRVNADLIFSHSITLFRQQRNPLAVAAATIAVLIAIALVRIALLRVDTKVNWGRLTESLRRPAPQMALTWKPTISVIAIWIGAYLVFLCFFEPQDPYLRLFYAPALILGFGLVLANHHYIDLNRQTETESRTPRPAVLIVAMLGLLNLAFFIAPHLRGDSNQIVDSAQRATTIWNNRTVVIFADHNEADTTFQYFNNGTRWRKLSSDLLPHLDDHVRDIYDQGGDVWLNRGALKIINPEWLPGLRPGREITVDVPYAPAHYIQLLPED
jgi:hypothetical protein